MPSQYCMQAPEGSHGGSMFACPYLGPLSAHLSLHFQQDKEVRSHTILVS